MDQRANILRIARRKYREWGMNGFSFRDIAHDAGIKSSSVHYYFPTKEDLCLALVLAEFAYLEQALDQIERDHADTHAKLNAFFDLFIPSADFIMPLPVVMVSEWAMLDDRTRTKLSEFMDIFDLWLGKTIRYGKISGDVRDDIIPEIAAADIMAVLLGSCLLVKASGDYSYFKLQKQRLVHELLPINR